MIKFIDPFFSKNQIRTCSKKPQDIKVIVGTNDLRAGGIRYNAKKLVMHEKYNQPLAANDIAVIEIDGTIKFDGYKVQPIKYSNKIANEGAGVARVFGWGRLNVMSSNKIQIIFLGKFTSSILVWFFISTKIRQRVSIHRVCKCYR